MPSKGRREFYNRRGTIYYYWSHVYMWRIKFSIAIAAKVHVLPQIPIWRNPKHKSPTSNNSRLNHNSRNVTSDRRNFEIKLRIYTGKVPKRGRISRGEVSSHNSGKYKATPIDRCDKSQYPWLNIDSRVTPCTPLYPHFKPLPL